MAEILILNRTDAPSYEPGDIIVVRPDGWKWGKQEGPPKFKLIKIPGVPVEDLEIYSQPNIQSIEKEIEVEAANFNPNELPSELYDTETYKPMKIGDERITSDGKRLAKFKVREKVWTHKRRFRVDLSFFNHGEIMSLQDFRKATKDKRN